MRRSDSDAIADLPGNVSMERRGLLRNALSLRHRGTPSLQKSMNGNARNVSLKAKDSLEIAVRAHSSYGRPPATKIDPRAGMPRCRVRMLGLFVTVASTGGNAQTHAQNALHSGRGPAFAGRGHLSALQGAARGRAPAARVRRHRVCQSQARAHLLP